MLCHYRCSRFDGELDSFAKLHIYICSYWRILDFHLCIPHALYGLPRQGHRGTDRRAQARDGVGVKNNRLYLRELFYIINCKYNFGCFGRLALFAFIKIQWRTSTVARREIVHNKKISNNKKKRCCLYCVRLWPTRLVWLPFVPILLFFLWVSNFEKSSESQWRPNEMELFSPDARISLRHVASVSSRPFSVELSVVYGDTLFTLFSFYFIFILLLRLLRCFGFLTS